MIIFLFSRKPSVSGSAMALSLGLALLSLLSACPDPCLIGGNSCNDNSDCAEGQHCLAHYGRVTGDCTLVKGSCQPVENCDTAADCHAGECCDEISHRCAPAGACTAQCEKDDDCGPVEICATSINRCRPACILDGIRFACDPGSLCLDSGYCSLPVGAPCDLDKEAEMGTGPCGNDMVCLEQRVVAGCINPDSPSVALDDVQMSKPKGFGYCAMISSVYYQSCGSYSDRCPTLCPDGSCYSEVLKHGEKYKYCVAPEAQ